MFYEAVFAEIVNKGDTPEALALIEFVKNKSVIVEKIRVHQLLLTSKIEQAEKEAISLAHQYRCTLIMDDATARKYAALLKVETKGSLSILLKATPKTITKNEAKSILNEMISNGFYVSTDVYGECLEQLK